MHGEELGELLLGHADVVSLKGIEVHGGAVEGQEELEGGVDVDEEAGLPYAQVSESHWLVDVCCDESHVGWHATLEAKTGSGREERGERVEVVREAVDEHVLHTHHHGLQPHTSLQELPLTGHLVHMHQEVQGDQGRRGRGRGRRGRYSFRVLLVDGQEEDWEVERTIGVSLVVGLQGGHAEQHLE